MGGDKSDVWQGTLALMVLKTLETLGPLHGYGIARRIEQTSGNKLLVNYGTLVSRAAEARAGGLHRVGVGRVRQQPQGEVLQADARGPQADREGRARVGEDDRDTRKFLVRKRLRIGTRDGMCHRADRDDFSAELESHLDHAHRR